MDKVIALEDRDGKIRTLQDERGQPWFVAADICKCLGLAIHARSGKPNVTVATRELSKQEKQLRRIDTSDNPRNPWTDMMTISESGLQKLVYKSGGMDAQRLFTRIKRLISENEVRASVLQTGSSMSSKSHANQF